MYQFTDFALFGHKSAVLTLCGRAQSDDVIQPFYVWHGWLYRVHTSSRYTYRVPKATPQKLGSGILQSLHAKTPEHASVTTSCNIHEAEFDETELLQADQAVSPKQKVDAHKIKLCFKNVKPLNGSPNVRMPLLGTKKRFSISRH
jgi:pullulanase/glycogen debranching enzyme